uniref:LIM homeobox transcription factor 1-beta.1-like n=1 Tax=Myxine glutinosa TaxID=7769 RepID=UPI00358E5B08
MEERNGRHEQLWISQTSYGSIRPKLGGQVGCVTRTNGFDFGGRCAGCGIMIRDRFLLCVGHEHWHEACLACTACLAPLRRTCYRRNHRPYCKQDYLR